MIYLILLYKTFRCKSTFRISNKKGKKCKVGLYKGVNVLSYCREVSKSIANFKASVCYKAFEDWVQGVNDEVYEYVRTQAKIFRINFPNDEEMIIVYVNCFCFNLYK